MPMLLALVNFINIVLSFNSIDIPLLSYIGGISFIPLVFLYISSYVFKFCEYHRIFLHYVVICNLINIYDYYIGIPITNKSLLILHLIIAGICLIIILYLYVKTNKKTTIETSRRY